MNNFQKSWRTSVNFKLLCTEILFNLNPDKLLPDYSFLEVPYNKKWLIREMGSSHSYQSMSGP